MLAQFVVEDATSQSLGLVLAYDADLVNGVAKLAIVSFNDVPSPHLMLGCALFSNYVFYCGRSGSCMLRLCNQTCINLRPAPHWGCSAKRVASASTLTGMGVMKMCTSSQ